MKVIYKFAGQSIEVERDSPEDFFLLKIMERSTVNLIREEVNVYKLTAYGETICTDEFSSTPTVADFIHKHKDGTLFLVENGFSKEYYIPLRILEKMPLVVEKKEIG